MASSFERSWQIVHARVYLRHPEDYIQYCFRKGAIAQNMHSFSQIDSRFRACDIYSHEHYWNPPDPFHGHGDANNLFKSRVFDLGHIAVIYLNTLFPLSRAWGGSLTLEQFI